MSEGDADPDTDVVQSKKEKRAGELSLAGGEFPSNFLSAETLTLKEA